MLSARLLLPLTFQSHYGAIRTNACRCRGHSFGGFNPTMVRLGRVGVGTGIGIRRCFNPTMVRLGLLLRGLPHPQHPRFNPTMVRLGPGR